EVGEALRGQVRGQPGDGAGPLALLALAQPLDAVDVLDRAPLALVEGEVYGDAPAALLLRHQVVVGQLVLVGDVPEDDLSGAGGAAPGEVELVAQLAVLDPQFLGQQAPREGDPVAGVVVDLGRGEDGVHGDAGDFEADAWDGLDARLP